MKTHTTWIRKRVCFLGCDTVISSETIAEALRSAVFGASLGHYSAVDSSKEHSHGKQFISLSLRSTPYYDLFILYVSVRLYLISIRWILCCTSISKFLYIYFLLHWKFWNDHLFWRTLTSYELESDQAMPRALLDIICNWIMLYILLKIELYINPIESS